MMIRHDDQRDSLKMQCVIASTTILCNMYILTGRLSQIIDSRASFRQDLLNDLEWELHS